MARLVGSKRVAAQAAQEKQDQLEREFEDYNKDAAEHPEFNLPVFDSIDEWLVYRNRMAEGGEAVPEYTDAQYQEYNRYQRLYSAFANPSDRRALNIENFFKNHDVYNEQVTGWQAEEEKAIKEYSPEDRQEYAEYKRLESAYATRTEDRALDIEDFYANYDLYMTQIQDWRIREEEDIVADQWYEDRQAQEREYALDPEEEARRRAESYQKSLEYGAEPDYRAQSYTWESQWDEPVPYQEYLRNQYPRLEYEFAKTMPAMPTFASLEEAEAEKARREQAYQAWLPEREKGLEQEWYMRSPTERGERPSVYAPPMRYVNY